MLEAAMDTLITTMTNDSKLTREEKVKLLEYWRDDLVKQLKAEGLNEKQVASFTTFREKVLAALGNFQ